MTALPRRSALPRSLLRTSGTGALLALLLATTAQPAHAHDELVDSSPAAGDQLAAPPTQVTLTFSDDILTIGPAVVVADAAGGTWTSGDPVLDGSTVVVPLLPDAPDGSYEVRWRVVSSDGHPISGLVPFTVGDGVVSGDPSGAATTPPPAGPGPSTAPGPSAAPADERPTGSSVPRAVVVGGAGALGALAVAWAITTVRSRRTSRQP